MELTKFGSYFTPESTLLLILETATGPVVVAVLDFLDFFLLLSLRRAPPRMTEKFIEITKFGNFLLYLSKVTSTEFCILEENQCPVRVISSRIVSVS